MNDRHALLRSLPSVDSLLAENSVQNLIEQYNRELVVDAIRTEIDLARVAILQREQIHTDESALVAAVESHLRRQLRPSLRPVINATGVIIHTNLGRALLSNAARQAMLNAAGAYNTLEFDLESGKRGSRLVHARQDPARSDRG